MCTENKNHTKVVNHHVWEAYIEQAKEIRHITGMKEIYNKRWETVERVFADAKLHGIPYTRYRGLVRVKMEFNLLFARMNLKKLANRLF